MYSWSDLNTVKEVHHYLSTFLEFLGIFFRPPVFQISVFVILTSLVIKSMCHFMTDNNSDSTVIHCIISIHIKEWRLQDSCREADLIGCRVVISINGLRSHQPFILIYWFAGFGNHLGIPPFIGTFDICPIRIVFNIQG